MTAISAAPDTWLVNLDPNAPWIPILGWSVMENGTFAMPIIPVAGKTILSGDAYVLPNEGVFDPVWNKDFESIEMWRRDVAEAEPYIPGKVPGVAGTDGKTPPPLKKRAESAEAFRAQQAEREAKKNAPPNPPGRPAKTLDAAPVGLVVMGNKVFKGTSYWRYTDADFDFVFSVEPGSPLPNDSCATKINREAYFVARKTVPEMVLPSDQPELPLAGEDEEDGMDMV